jgi:hypothetical protein
MELCVPAELVTSAWLPVEHFLLHSFPPRRAPDGSPVSTVHDHETQAAWLVWWTFSGSVTDKTCICFNRSKNNYQWILLVTQAVTTPVSKAASMQTRQTQSEEFSPCGGSQLSLRSSVLPTLEPSILPPSGCEILSARVLADVWSFLFTSV